MDETQSSDPKLSLLGLDLSAYSPRVQVGLVTVAFLASWMTYGVLQERLMNVDRFPYAWTVTFLQVAIYSSLGLLDSWREAPTPAGMLLWPQERKGRLYLGMLVLLSAGELVLHRGVGNLAFRYLDYSTKVLFQSAKIFPVLVLGVLLFP